MPVVRHGSLGSLRSFDEVRCCTALLPQHWLT